MTILMAKELIPKVVGLIIRQVYLSLYFLNYGYSARSRFQRDFREPGANRPRLITTGQGNLWGDDTD